MGCSVCESSSRTVPSDSAATSARPRPAKLKTYEKSVLQGMVDRGASLEDRLRPRARFAVQHEHEVRAKASAGRDLGPANRAWLKAARKMNWTGRKHTAQGNNDPHTRRVRVLTDRMRSTVHIRDL